MKKKELIFLLKEGEVVARTREGKEVGNYENLIIKLKYYYRRLKIADLGMGRYQVLGKKGFEILVEEA